MRTSLNFAKTYFRTSSVIGLNLETVFISVYMLTVQVIEGMHLINDSILSSFDELFNKAHTLVY